MSNTNPYSSSERPITRSRPRSSLLTHNHPSNRPIMLTRRSARENKKPDALKPENASSSINPDSTAGQPKPGTQPNPKSSAKPKRPLLRSVPAPVTRATSKGTKSLPNKDSQCPTHSSVPVRSRNAAPKSLEETNPTKTKNAKLPVLRPAAPSRSQPPKQTQQAESMNKKHSTRPLLRSSPTPRVPQLEKEASEEDKTLPTTGNQTSSHTGSSTTPLRSEADPKVDEKLQRRRRRAIASVLEEAAARNKAKNPFAKNSVELSRLRKLPLPLGNPTPPRGRRAVGQILNPPARVPRTPVTDASSPGKSATRKPVSATRPAPETKAPRNRHLPPTDSEVKSRLPARPTTSRRTTSQRVEDSSPVAVKRRTRARRKEATFSSSDEYSSESSQRPINSKREVSVSSDSDTGSSEYESDSSSEPSPPTKSGKSIAGKAIPRHVALPRSSSDSGKAEKSTEGSGVPRRNIDDEYGTRKSVAGKTISRKTVAGKTVATKTVAGKTVTKNAKKTIAGGEAAAKSVAGKTVAKKTVAHKTVAGKSVAGKILPEMSRHRIRVHAGGNRSDSKSSRTESDLQQQQKTTGKTDRGTSSNERKVDKRRKEDEAGDDAKSDSDKRDSYKDSSSDSGSESDSGSDDTSGSEDSDGENADDSSEDGSERKVENEEAERLDKQSERRGFENRRKQMREICSKKLQEQKKKEYCLAVREEFFLEMEYHMYLERQFNGGDVSRVELVKAMDLFDKMIALLRIEGLESLGCDLELENYRCWRKLFNTKMEALQRTTDAVWQSNYTSVLKSLKEVSGSANDGAQIEVNEKQLKFITENWELLKEVLDMLSTYSSEMLRIQSEGGGCQLQ